jgi:integrase
MVRALHKLNARRVATLVDPGRYGDGGGLFLMVSLSGARKWVFRYRFRDGRHDMGLGSAGSITLSKARELAASARTALANGIDPLTTRRKPTTPTFGETADQLIAALSPSWRNEKHRAQWRMTLKTYAAPLRPLAVDQIAVHHVLAVLKPIWATKPETASRLRGRIEKVLDAARAKGHRTGENPARWRGHLDHLLPIRQRLTRGHHAAMPYVDVPRFLMALRTQESVAARALEFLILTAGRTGEVLGMRWPEIDLANRLWTVPANRMKAGREHRVPLVARAIEILAMMKTMQTSDFVFPGLRWGKPLSNMALEMVLRRMKVEAVTVHGFRSSFRDWAGESTRFSREVAEAALAHTIGDQTERAYRRGDALEKRRELMEAWAEYCEPRKPADILPMRRALKKL